MKGKVCPRCLRRRVRAREAGREEALELIEVNLAARAWPAADLYVEDLLPGYVRPYEPEEWLRQPRTVLAVHRCARPAA